MNLSNKTFQAQTEVDEEEISNPLNDAFATYRKAWFEGLRLDPEDFCQTRTPYGNELRGKIEDFLFVAEGLPRALGGHEACGEEAPPHLTDDTRRILGDFRILRLIGEGGMGRVYEAEQISLKRKVALKILPPHMSLSSKAVKKFRREAQAGGRQKHPGIVAIHAIGEDRGLHYIAQELVEGFRTIESSLDEFREKGLPSEGYFEDVARLFADVAEALQHAHDSGVIHRDIKPSNILITSEGRPKITDFGLSKVEDDAALSRTGEYSGTPYYTSPEQAMSRRIDIDHRTDIFSLGVTLYETLTLERPFDGENKKEVFRKIIFHEPKDPRAINPAVPRDLAVICLKALEKKPEHRFGTMKDFSEDLRCFCAGDGISIKPTGSITMFFRRNRRFFLPRILIGLFALIVLTSIAVFTQSGGSLMNAGTGRPSYEVVPTTKIDIDIIDFNGKSYNSHPYRLGELKKVAAKEGDAAQLKITLSEPCYCVLIALNPDGSQKLCYPEDENTWPMRVKTIHYPENWQDGYKFVDGNGFQMFAVLMSKEILLPYRTFKSKIAKIPWTPIELNEAWSYNDKKVELLDDSRGEIKTLWPGAAQFEQICVHLKTIQGIDEVHAVAFPIRNPED